MPCVLLAIRKALTGSTFCKYISNDLRNACIAGYSRLVSLRPIPSRVQMAFVHSCVAMSCGPATESTSATKCAPHRQVLNLLCGAAVASMLVTAPVIAAPKLPPIDYSVKDRCKPVSSNVGQANAARDTLLDLRECQLPKLSFHGDLSGALLADSDMSDSDLEGVQFSKAFAQGIKLSRSNLTNAVLDRVDFSRADLSGAILANAVLSDSIFDNANVENADFTDAYIGDFAQRALCKNPTLKGENPVTGAPTRESLGCR